jgi:hypothetical protein
MVNLLADGLSQHTKSILPLYKALVNDTSRVYPILYTTTIILALLFFSSSFILYI